MKRHALLLALLLIAALVISACQPQAPVVTPEPTSGAVIAPTQPPETPVPVSTPAPPAATPAPLTTPAPVPTLAPTPLPDALKPEVLNVLWPLEAQGVPETEGSPIITIDLYVPKGTASQLSLYSDANEMHIAHIEVAGAPDGRDLVTMSSTAPPTAMNVHLFYGEGATRVEIGSYAVPDNIPCVVTQNVYGRVAAYSSADGGDIRQCGPLDGSVFPGLPQWVTIQYVTAIESRRGDFSFMVGASSPSDRDVRTILDNIVGKDNIKDTNGVLTAHADVGGMEILVDVFPASAADGFDGFIPKTKPAQGTSAVYLTLLTPQYNTEVRADDDPEMEVGDAHVRVERSTLYSARSEANTGYLPTGSQISVLLEVSSDRADDLKAKWKDFALSDEEKKRHPAVKLTADGILFAVPFDVLPEMLVFGSEELQIPLP